MIEKIIVVGLTVGFFIYWWFNISSAKNEVIKRWGNWWYGKDADRWNGKPFVCEFCMSFWISLILLLAAEFISIWHRLYLLTNIGCQNCFTLEGFMVLYGGNVIEILFWLGSFIGTTISSAALAMLFEAVMKRLNTTILR